jgi:phage-related protein
MAIWTFFDYVEVSGRNPVREWLNGLPDEDQAKIDARLLQMAGMAPPWPEKWISKYHGTELFEFRITGNRVQYRPLGIYFGKMTYILLAGAIEKGDKIPKRDVETAVQRLANLRKDQSHATIHDFGAEEDLEEDGP